MLRWSPARECVAFTLDGAGCISCWDFSRSRKAPAATLRLEAAAPARCCAFALSQAAARASRQAGGAGGQAVARAGGGRQQGLASGAQGKGAAAAAAFVVAFSDGSVQWHLMPGWLSEAQPGDADALQDVLA